MRSLYIHSARIRITIASTGPATAPAIHALVLAGDDGVGEGFAGDDKGITVDASSVTVDGATVTVNGGCEVGAIGRDSVVAGVPAHLTQF